MCELLLAGCFFIMGGVLGESSPQVQNAPVTEPRRAHEEKTQHSKGAMAITTSHSKCVTLLSVDPDALFQPHRWTLNPDADQTLDVLGPMILQAGKHPARIVAFTSASDSEAENRDVSQRRAITVRTWLVNHHFVPAGTPAEASPTKPDDGPAAQNQKSHGDNGTLQVIVDSCH
jgi:outer membrane protein OmpA-like peptidoglycan-associated protein